MLYVRRVGACSDYESSAFPSRPVPPVDRCLYRRVPSVLGASLVGDLRLSLVGGFDLPRNRFDSALCGGCGGVVAAHSHKQKTQ